MVPKPVATVTKLPTSEQQEVAGQYYLQILANTPDGKVVPLRIPAPWVASSMQNKSLLQSGVPVPASDSSDVTVVPIGVPVEEYQNKQLNVKEVSLGNEAEV